MAGGPRMFIPETLLVATGWSTSSLHKCCFGFCWREVLRKGHFSSCWLCLAQLLPWLKPSRLLLLGVCDVQGVQTEADNAGAAQTGRRRFHSTDFTVQISEEMICDSISNIRKRCEACIQAEGGHFEYFLWFYTKHWLFWSIFLFRLSLCDNYFWYYIALKSHTPVWWPCISLSL